VLSAEPGNAQAAQMQERALELEAHVRNLEAARRRGEWAMACVVLERCLRGVEADGSEIPVEWHVWRIEIELARANWDGANSAVKYVVTFFCFCLFLLLRLGLLIVTMLV